MEAIGVFMLYLGTNVFLDLENTYVVSYFQRNMVFISCLEKSGYNCSFGNGMFSIFQNSCLIGTGSLNDIHTN